MDKNLYGLLSTLYRRVRKLYPDEGDKLLRELAFWEVISALRGPDEDSVMVHGEEMSTTDLKHYTTARLRAILGMSEDRSSYCCDVNSNPLSDEEIVRRNRLLDACSMHFSTHFKDAMVTLRGLGYPVPAKELDFHARKPEELGEVNK